MNLKQAQLCLDCEEIFQGRRCPACQSNFFFPIERWLNREVQISNEWIDAVIESSIESSGLEQRQENSPKPLSQALSELSG